MILFTGQKNSHSDTNIGDDEMKREDFMNPRCMGVFVHVVTAM